MPGLKQVQLQKVQVPHYFRCPISLDLMRDPVTVATGQTYDRASIEKWVADGNRTCPATMQQLHDLTLIPNHTLRRLIQEWCVANRARGVERIPTPKQPADPRRIEALLRDCSSNGSGSSVAAALRSLRGLAKESDKNRALIAEAGAVPVLISAMFRRLDDDETVEKGAEKASSIRLSSSSEDDDLEVAEEALGVLVLLPMSEVDRSAVAESGLRLALVAGILQRGRSMDARINAASLVEKLAADATEAVKRAVGDSAGLMEGLVALLQGPEAMCPRAAKAGVRALFSLCLSASPSNSERAVAAGAAAALVEHLPEAQAGDADRTLGTLELLCRTVAGREAVGGHALAVPALVAAILRSDAVRSSNRPSCQATECAAGTLLAICSSSEAVQRAAVQAGVLTQLLLLIQSDCTGRAKRKAMELLKLLRSSWTEDPCLVELERTDVVAF